MFLVVVKHEFSTFYSAGKITLLIVIVSIRPRVIPAILNTSRVSLVEGPNLNYLWQYESDCEKRK